MRGRFGVKPGGAVLHREDAVEREALAGPQNDPLQQFGRKPLQRVAHQGVDNTLHLAFLAFERSQLARLLFSGERIEDGV